MTEHQAATLRQGLDCCIVSGKTHLCPLDCPYADQGGIPVDGAVLECSTLLLLDARERITELEKRIREGTK